ncbi:Ig-like domain-containing protein [Pseudolysinimonas sp.]|uniref:Ig-like domain-containing protein n=1 Tax=Pseudolysinimonas sp. TaxID=2680009 RepID=UPI003F7FB5A0
MGLASAGAAHADGTTALTASDVQATTRQGQAVTIQLQGSGPAGDALTYGVLPPSGSAHGTVTTGGFMSPTVTYTPTAGFVGVASFQYNVSDATSSSALATVTVTVTPASPDNHAPVAAPGALTVQGGDQALLPFAATDVDGDHLTYRIVSPPLHGSTLAVSGGVLYTPNDDYAGPDSVSFVANDGVLDSAPATISITVTPARPNTPPTSTPPSITTPENTAVQFTLTATDADGDPVFFSVGGADHGTVTSGQDGRVSYTPDLGFTGQDRIYYFVTDNRSSSPDYWAQITVTPTGSTPHAPAVQSFHVQAQSAVGQPLTLQGTDPDGNALTYTVVTPPAHGALTGTGADLVYTSATGYSGPDSFTYTASDGALVSAPAAVEIDVVPVFPPPVWPFPDAQVSTDQSKASSRLVSPAITSTDPGELFVAFVAADGPVPGSQKVASLSGGGLTWSLVKRSNGAGGTAEIWAARAPSPVRGAVVTAKLANPGYDGSITVAAFGHGASVGTAVGASATHGSPALSVPAGPGSAVWSVGHDWSTATLPTPVEGQRLEHTFLDRRVGDSFWTQSSQATAAGSMPVGDSLLSGDRWELTAVEIHLD